MKIAIATNNPSKIEGTKKAFSHYFNEVEIMGIAVNSNVSEQPINEEIYEGANNRIKNLKNHCNNNNIEADFYVSIESGITNQLGKWLILNIALIEDNGKFQSYGTSSGFPVPEKYVDEIINTDLTKVMDKLFNTKDIGKGKGGIGLLTKDIISRIDLTEEAFIMAIIQYINNDWTDKNNDLK